MYYILHQLYIGVHDSMRKTKTSKPEIPSSTPGSYYLYIVFIKNLINNKSKNKKTNVTMSIILSPHSYL